MGKLQGQLNWATLRDVVFLCGRLAFPAEAADAVKDLLKHL
jgi:hypothetical protein